MWYDWIVFEGDCCGYFVENGLERRKKEVEIIVRRLLKLFMKERGSLDTVGMERVDIVFSDY